MAYKSIPSLACQLNRMLTDDYAIISRSPPTHSALEPDRDADDAAITMLAASTTPTPT